MKWKARKKPVLGDKKEVQRFALFPVKVKDQWIWLCKYIAIREYQEYVYMAEEVVSEGIFTEKVRRYPAIGKGWRTIDRNLIPEN